MSGTLDVIKEPSVGRFSVEVDLANDKDLIRVEDGVLPADKVRRVRIRGVVDSGAAGLVIPLSVVKALGLESTGTTTVQYADRRQAQRNVVERVRLSYAGRSGVYAAIVEPQRDSVLIGAIVLEDLDLLVDARNGKLLPRNPAGTISEIE